MPSGAGHDFRSPTPFSDDPHQYFKHIITQQFDHFPDEHQPVYETHVPESPFCSLNFKLGLNSAAVDGGGCFGELGPRRDVPISWLTQQHPETVDKERFWKPLNRSNDDNGGNSNNISLEEKYRLFSELEAIYALPAAPDPAGSALTGPTAAAGPTGADRESEPSIGATKRKKRKRKEKMGIVFGFFERLVEKVLCHQETLNARFMEAIKKMDDDKTVRDEAWRREEAEKRERESNFRARERATASSREALVVRYIEKITGHTIETTKISDTNARWPRNEVEALIRARGAMETNFQESGQKGSLWEEVSSTMASLGYRRNAKRCKEKWDNINKYFRKKRNGSDRKSKSCSYFDQLDRLYSGSENGCEMDEGNESGEGGFGSA